MRAIEGSRRGRTWRGLTGITVVSLLGLAVLSGNVLAGNTSKAVYFGSGPFPAGTSFDYDANYSLSFTPVNGGGVTSTFVTVQNKASGTLNHVILQGGSKAPVPTANASFIPDGTNGSAPICTQPPATVTCIPSLPSGFSYVAAYAPSGHPCTIYDASGLPATTGIGIQCDVGQLATNASVTFRLAIKVPAYDPATPNTYKTWLTVSGNEGTSNEGSNQDAFFALGNINVGPNTACSDANFFTSGAFVGFGAPACDQPSTLTGGSFANGAFALVKVYNDNLCLTGYKCFGKRVDAAVEFGAPVTGGLQWTVMWQKSSLNGTPKGFIHFLDAYLAGTDLTAYEIINFKTTALCPATITSTTTLPCLNGKPGFVTEAGISYFKAVFTTGANGAGRGT
jgi:hypothetical protein